MDGRTDMSMSVPSNLQRPSAIYRSLLGPDLKKSERSLRGPPGRNAERNQKKSQQKILSPFRHFLGVCPFVLQDLCRASRSCTGSKGAVGSRSKNQLFPGAMKQMLVRGHNLRLLDKAGETGTSTTKDKKPGQSAHAESTQGVFPRFSGFRPVGLGDFSRGVKAQRRAFLNGPMPVYTRTFREISEPLVHMNFRGNSYGPMAPLPCSQGNSYGPMALNVRQKFPARLVLVQGWLFPEALRDPIVRDVARLSRRYRAIS